ncbi:hypothetical protein C8F01DRAFT_1372827, partial [Mycena amicta]
EQDPQRTTPLRIHIPRATPGFWENESRERGLYWLWLATGDVATFLAGSSVVSSPSHVNRYHRRSSSTQTTRHRRRQRYAVRLGLLWAGNGLRCGVLTLSCRCTVQAIILGHNYRHRALPPSSTSTTRTSSFLTEWPLSEASKQGRLACYDAHSRLSRHRFHSLPLSTKTLLLSPIHCFALSSNPPFPAAPNDSTRVLRVASFAIDPQGPSRRDAS